MNDLTVSPVERQNILNNMDAVTTIQDYLGISGMLFLDEYMFTKEQIAEFYKIDVSTIDHYLAKYEDEIKHNGYQLLRGEKLKDFKSQFGGIIQVSAKTTQLGIFNFRSFLNLAMLLVESDMAKAIRSKMLDIVIDTINKKSGGSTKFINQRDDEFLISIIKEPLYRKEFTGALNDYLDMGNYKYSFYTDQIYKCIFKENAKEYKQILKLEKGDNPRDTMYAEVLNIIASFESGLAHEIEKKSKKIGRKITRVEMDNLLKDFSDHPLHKPHIENARTKMASRDYGFRGLLHENIKHYLKSINVSDYDRFLGDKSQELHKRIEENIDVFKRLNDR